MSRFDRELDFALPVRTLQQWANQGVRRGSLQGDRYARVGYGYYRRTPDDGVVTATQRILDARASMPAGALIAGWAAAYVHGVDALDGLDDHTLTPLPVPVLLPPRQHREHAHGIRYQQTKRPIRGELVHDIPVTMRLRTALDLARSAPTLTESVVPLDAFLGARLLTTDQLRRGVERWPSGRGTCQLRAAVAQARVGVRNGWETRLRMFAVLELGLTDLEPNRAVFDQRGNLLGIPDLLDAEAALALEYDGATWRSDRTMGHRDREQHREDNAREERLERAGLIVVRAEKSDLTQHAARLGERILSARADGLRRDRSRDHWTLDEPDSWFGVPA